MQIPHNQKYNSLKQHFTQALSNFDRSGFVKACTDFENAQKDAFKLFQLNKKKKKDIGNKKKSKSSLQEPPIPLSEDG